MNRRGFMHSILALGAAPAIVRVGSLMKASGIVMPTLEETILINGEFDVEFSGGVQSFMGEEMLRLTRAAFVPKLIAQIYDTSPLVSMLMNEGRQ